MQNRGKYGKKKQDDKKQAEQTQTEKSGQAEQSSSTQGTANEAYDQQQLQDRLELILKLKKDKEGGDPANKSKEQQIQDAHQKLQTLVANLVDKIQKKHESLMLSQQQLTVYQETLKQKYAPIFQ